MKQLIHLFRQLFYVLILAAALSCNNKQSTPPPALIKQLNLKRGDIISCGPSDAQFGSANFEVTGNQKTKKDFK